MKLPENLARLLLHLPVGAFNAWLFSQGPALGAAFLLMFAVYELNEDMRLKDGAWKDIAGWLWGYAIYLVLLHLYLRFVS